MNIRINFSVFAGNSAFITLDKLKILRLKSTLIVCFFFTISSCGEPIYSECEWPCFHGPDRTNKSAETGMIQEWPQNGPELLWTASGLGEGYSSISISEGFIFTAGMADNQTYVFAYDLNGNQVWKQPNGKAWSTTMSHASSYTGSRSTPTCDNGVIYHLGETGRLAAFESESGKELWYRELIEEFDAEDPEYGYSESVLIDGDYLYTQPAGSKGFQICLDKHNGELIWANTEIPGSKGYTSTVILEFGSYRQIIGASSNCYYGVDSRTGKLLWKVDFENSQGLNIADAIVYNDYVFISSGYGNGCMLVKLKFSGKEIITETVWQSESMDNHHGGIILHNGYLYGSGSNSRGWFCLDFLTGEQLWKSNGKGSVTYADGMLYLLEERGIMKLVQATPDTYNLKGEYQVPEGGEGMCWAHPVVCGGRLYIRHADRLFAYDISGN